MKIRFIYSEKTENIEDMSNDKIQLNLTYQEWRKLKSFIDCAEYELKKDSFMKSTAKYLFIMFDKAQRLKPRWSKN